MHVKESLLFNVAVERCTLDTCGLCGETVHSANVALAVAALMLDHKPFNSVFTVRSAKLLLI